MVEFIVFFVVVEEIKVLEVVPQSLEGQVI